MAPEPLTPQGSRFDIPDGIAYLNCAYFSPKPHSVLEAGRHALDVQSRPWQVAPRDFYEPAEGVRRRFADLIGGDADGVAFVPSVSYGVGVAARNLEVGAGKKVVVLDEQFPSDLYPWRAEVDDGGGIIVTVPPPPPDQDWTQAVIDTIDPSVAVVAVAACHWTDGRAVDLAAVGRAAREAGAALVVDLSQSLGAVPFDVTAVQPDFLVTVGYKWQFGPYGYGYMWVAPQHRQGVPLESTWFGRKGSEDFSRLVDYTDEFQPGARRFDVGEFSNFTLVPMADAALEFLLDLDPVRISEYLAPLTARIEEGTRALGLDPVPAAARHPHLIGVRFPSGLPAGLRDRLAADRVYVSVRGDSVRVAPNVYNTTADVDRLLGALAAV